MIMIYTNFIFNIINFCLIVNFLTKLITLSVSFSAVVRAVVVVKIVMLGILFLTAIISALRTVLVAKLVISVILPSIFLISTYFWSQHLMATFQFLIFRTMHFIGKY